MSKIKSQKRHTRILFKPLTTSCALVCVTPLSPSLQTFVTVEGAPHYDPDRRLTPTVILPDVKAYDPDGVFTRGSANEYLSTLSTSLQWTVDGKPIEKVWKVSTDKGATGDYSIDTEKDARGSLILYRNLSPQETHVLKFRGRFVDPRTNLTYKVESNELRLSTSDKGADALNCCVSDSHIVYDALTDELLFFDYCAARHIPNGDAPRERYIGGRSFDRTVDVIFSVGKEPCKVLPKGITMEMVVNGTNTAIVPSPEHPELIEVAYPKIRLDLRLVNRVEYELRFKKAGKVVCHSYINVVSKTSLPTECKPQRASDLSASQLNYFNSALFNFGNRWIQFPELYYSIEWFTQARTLQKNIWVLAEMKKWQRGEHLFAPVAELGIGKTYNDACFDVWFEASAHDTRALLKDENGNVWTDEKGNWLID